MLKVVFIYSFVAGWGLRNCGQGMYVILNIKQEDGDFVPLRVPMQARFSNFTVYYIFAILLFEIRVMSIA